MNFFIIDGLCEVGEGCYELTVGLKDSGAYADATYYFYHKRGEEFAELENITFYDEDGDEIDEEVAAGLGFDYPSLRTYLDVTINDYLR